MSAYRGSGDGRVTARELCAAHIQRSGLVASEAGLFWLESCPGQARTRLCHRDGQGCRVLEAGDEGFSSRVNGYGGGILAALADTVVAVTDSQCLLALDVASGRRQVLVEATGAAWGGLVADPVRNRVLAVREADNRQQLVSVDIQGRCRVLHQGLDFYSAPALSPCGRWLAWVSWQLPDMPWIRSCLWLARLNREGTPERAFPCPAPAPGAVQQPVFTGGSLWVLSDHRGWWQPWWVETDTCVWRQGDTVPLDHANAPWQLGERHHCPLPGSSWARVRYRNGCGELWLAGADGRETRPGASLVYTDFRALAQWRGQLVCIARAPDRFDSIVALAPQTGRLQVLAGGERPPGKPPRWPQSLTVPGAEPVQVFFYEPEGAKVPPPVVIVAHGGPTSAAYPVYDPGVRFWCQHGFAVAEVNYRGSSGFGRAFRMVLAGHWGEHDVADLQRTARYLVGQGLVDGQRVFVQGRSAGGYSALMAVAGNSGFCAAGSIFGVTDPLQLRQQTHRFESGYLDWLLGDPGLHASRWQARSPCALAARIRTPVIFFQGRQDQVVVPEQTNTMVQALRRAGAAVAVHWFDEGHGFRNPDNQACVLETLYRFYQKAGRKTHARQENLS